MSLARTVCVSKINLNVGGCPSLYKYLAIPLCFVWFFLLRLSFTGMRENHHSPSLKTGIYTTAQKYKLFSSMVKAAIS
jgi:hypothetical protein